MNWLFASGGQNIGASASVLPMNIWDWFPEYWYSNFEYQIFIFLGIESMNIDTPMNIQDWLIWSPCSPRDSQESSPTHSSKASILQCSAFFTVQLSHPYMTTGKTIALTRWTCVGKVMSLLFNKLSRFVITFLPRSKRLLISWLQSPSAVILEPPKIKSDTVSPSISHEVIGPDAMIFIFCMLSFKPTFPSPLSLSSRGFLVPLHFLP